MNKQERMNILTSKESQDYWKKVINYDMQPPKVKKNPTTELCDWYERVINRIHDYGTEWEEQMNVKSACHSGCNACCSMIIEVFKFEAFVIIEYIKKTNQEYLFDRIETIYDRMNSIIAESPLGTGREEEITKFKSDYLKNKIPCVFIVDGKCSIYPVRPINCATYHSYGIAEECLLDDEINNPNSDAFIIDWPLEKWSARQFGYFFSLNSKKYQNLTVLEESGVLPLVIKECLDTKFVVVKK